MINSIVKKLYVTDRVWYGVNRVIYWAKKYMIHVYSTQIALYNMSHLSYLPTCLCSYLFVNLTV